MIVSGQTSQQNLQLKNSIFIKFISPWYIVYSLKLTVTFCVKYFILYFYKEKEKVPPHDHLSLKTGLPYIENPLNMYSLSSNGSGTLNKCENILQFYSMSYILQYLYPQPEGVYRLR